MSVTLYTHPDCMGHDMPGHPECPARLASILARLDASGLAGELHRVEATEISANDVTRVHQAEFVDAIGKSSPESGLVHVDGDTFMAPDTLHAASLAAGALAAATSDVLRGDASAAFCATRPPGHHAEVNAAMGFCFYNSVAIAADMALDEPGVERVAILDFDVHHCNGTVDVFKDRPEILVCSSFQQNHYPHRYLDFSNDHIINTPLEAGTGSQAFRQAIEATWVPAIDRHKPDLILVSAGFDAHRDDPLGEVELLTDDYDWITRLICALAHDHAGGRVVSTLEGGYHLEALAASVEQHVGALVQEAG